jgi:hypothetical protein
MATDYKTYKDSSDAQRDITSLRGILARQQQFLKSRKSSDPEYVEAKNAIKETLASIKKAEEIFKKFDAVEKQTKKEETLTTAQENLTYAKESGNPAEVVSAQNAVDKARKDVNAVKEAEAAATAKAKADRDKKVTSNAGYIGYKGPAVTPIKTEGPFKDATTATTATGGTITDKPVVPAPRTSTGPQRTGGEMGGPGFDPSAVSSEQRYADAIAKAYELYQMPDIIFKNVPSLGKLLQRYLDNKLTLAQFQQEVGNDVWFRKNSAEIKNRWVQKFNYDDLVTSGQAQGTTAYEQSIAKIAQDVQVRARAIGAVVDDTQAKQIAQDLYIYNQEADDTYVTNRLSGFIRSQSGMIGGNVTEGYSGQALQNYQALQASAKANGFKLEDILPKNAQGAPQTAQQVLQGLATGTIDSTRLQQDVRKLAAQGQPQYVRDLLGQGYDLETIYAPYKQRLASVLELNPDQVQLNDPSLRQAITDKGDMNLYDFERALRKDGRWQYTTDAKKTVADSAMSVLRDFGFQG